MAQLFSLGSITRMDLDEPKKKRQSNARWKRRASTVFWYALIFSVIFALGSYISLFNLHDFWAQDIFADDVKHDTVRAFGRRLLLGACAGAVIGLLVSIRDRKDDDAA